MSRIDRRSMLKVMAATAAGAAGTALGGPALESALAATPGPGGGAAGGHQASASTRTPLVVATTPGTSYLTYPGAAFTAPSSAATWNVGGTIKRATNGGFYERLFALPQGVTITECKFFLVNPTTLPQCYIISGSLDGLTFTLPASGAPVSMSATVQAIDLTVTPTKVDNSQLWYLADIETVAATDVQIYGVRVGWINNPGLTLFPDPRRIVDGFATPFVSGNLYGPINATLKAGGALASGVPVGAKSAFCAVQSYTAGALTVFPDGAADPGIANYTATQSGPLNLTYMMVPLSTAGMFKVHSYISGACFIDAWGYVF